MREWADRIAGAVGESLLWREAESELPERFDYLGVRRHDFVVSSERIRLELGFREVTTRESRLTGLVDWLRDSRGP